MAGTGTFTVMFISSQFKKKNIRGSVGTVEETEGEEKEVNMKKDRGKEEKKEKKYTV